MCLPRFSQSKNRIHFLLMPQMILLALQAEHKHLIIILKDEQKLSRSNFHKLRTNHKFALIISNKECSLKTKISSSLSACILPFCGFSFLLVFDFLVSQYTQFRCMELLYDSWDETRADISAADWLETTLPHPIIISCVLLQIHPVFSTRLTLSFA